jgi:hypothetical protein
MILTLGFLLVLFLFLFLTHKIEGYWDHLNNSAFNVSPKFWSFRKLDW